MKYACKHDFIIPEHLSRFHDHIFGGHGFAAYIL